MSTPIHSVAVQGTEQVFIRQEWSAYTGEQHRAWSLLFRKRRDSLRNTACRAFLEGIELIGLNEHTIPDLEELNGRLQPCTGWSAIPVSGFLHPHDFFCCLAQRKFPTTVTIRPLGRLDYIPEPDIFHDVFGHVPMHANKVFADFLQRFGSVASRGSAATDQEALTRLFWFTVEFGLLREANQVKVYGSGLISSQADCANALSAACEVREFRLQDVIRQGFSTDELQRTLFVISSFDQLFQAVEDLEERLRRGRPLV